jgi:AraC family transcriptional regulator
MDHARETVIAGLRLLYDELGQGIDLSRLAERLGLSADHFNRLFRSVTGSSAYAFILGARLDRAASRLAKCPLLSVTEIAAEVGMSPSNFSTAFKARFGVSPSAFRLDPKLNLYDSPSGHRADLLARRRLRGGARDGRFSEFGVIRMPDLALFRKRFLGNYGRLGPAWEEFCARYAGMALDPAAPEWYGISYDDPFLADQNLCSYDLCLRISADAPIAHKSGASVLRIPEGPYAVMRYTGPLCELYEAYDELLAFFMPARGLKPANSPVLERYFSSNALQGTCEVQLAVPIL